MVGRRTPEKRRYAAEVLERRANAIARMRRQADTEGQRIDFLANLVGLMENPAYARLRNMAKAVVEDMKTELVEIDLSTSEGNKQGLALQAEIRSMNWFARGTDHLSVELRERKDRKGRLQVEIEESDRVERKRQERETKNRLNQA